MRKVNCISTGSGKAVVCMKMNKATKVFTQKLKWKVSDGNESLIYGLRIQ